MLSALSYRTVDMSFLPYSLHLPRIFILTLRFVHPIEEHMVEAIASVRHDKEIMFDEQSILQPAVKQKYIGHRNARYSNYFQKCNVREHSEGPSSCIVQ
jgi:hypothetical protein